MIYFIRDTLTGLVKIGTAENPWRRLAKIQSDSPGQLEMLAIEDGGVERETELHREFASARRRGEWFAPADRLMAYVTDCGPAPKPPRAGVSRAFWGGMSDAEISRAMQISKPYLSEIRGGTRRPSPALAIQLQKLTGKSAVELVFRELAAEAA